jgi:hypothetical protein
MRSRSAVAEKDRGSLTYLIVSLIEVITKFLLKLVIV